MYNSDSFYLIASWRKEECPLKLSELQSKFGWLLIPAAVLVLVAFYFLNPQEKPEENLQTSLDLIQAEPLQQTETPTQDPVPTTLMVDIKGQVAKPGVYELPVDSRMTDAIDAAGGFLAAAEPKAINLAMKVVDEMVIYVPEIGEEAAVPTAQPGTAAAGSAKEALVNLNTATDAELMTLPGIGPSKAEAIIAYRTDSGNFQKIEDLKNVTGIGDKTFEKLKDSITVN
ncbi:helix-hairpin-helix domain-containing protein [Planomicrobium glaciei]|nr:helix-hairpin-helix domain-containing protein [Planococcus glaciei]